MLIALGAGGNVILSYYTVEIILALGVSQKEALYVYAAKLCFIVIANFCSSYLLVRFNRKNILIVLAIALIISQVLLPVFSERPEMVFKYLSVSIWVDRFQKNIFGRVWPYMGVREGVWRGSKWLRGVVVGIHCRPSSFPFLSSPYTVCHFQATPHSFIRQYFGI